MRHFLLTLVTLGLAAASQIQAQVKVAVLHPLLGDLAQQIGGQNVTVLNLVKPGTELHHFDPSAKDFAALKGVSLVLAAGKNGENYLDKLADALGGGVKILEVGKAIPSLKDGQEHVDPHWWHSAANMKRAARIIADELSSQDPAHSEAYKTGAADASKKLDELHTWAQQQFTQIPKKDRVLVSAHNAFGYFCQDYGFKNVPVLGLSAEDDITPNQVVATLKIIRENKVQAVFPEDQANPKVLEEITRESGARIGTPLNADGTLAGEGSTFAGMLKHNVEAIVKGLKR